MIRLASIKSQTGTEFVAIQPNGVMIWGASEAGVICQFPVCLSDVEAFFARAGRVFDETRLPNGFVADPWCSFV